MKDLISKLLYKFPLLAFFYNFEFVKRLYKRYFVSHVHGCHYYIEIVNRCNAECIFCPYVPLKNTGKTLMNISDETFNKAVSLIGTHKRPSILLTPTTGEVFVNPKWEHYVQKVLAMDFVKEVGFYTNAILLNLQNREKLLSLKNIHKMFLSFSVGGADKDTYKYLYGKDLFDVVTSNINEFLMALKSNFIKMSVSIDVKLLKNSDISWLLAKKVYNKCDYKYAVIKVRHEFDTLHGLFNNKNLKMMRPSSVLDKKYPCKFLNDIRFAADGSIWLCGCAISELPLNYDLKIGDVKHENDLKNTMLRQKDVQRKWFYNKEIPYSCTECSWYVKDRFN